MSFDIEQMANGKTKAINVANFEYKKLDAEQRDKIEQLLSDKLNEASIIDFANIPAILKTIGFDYKEYSEDLGSFIQKEFAGVFIARKKVEINGKVYQAALSRFETNDLLPHEKEEEISERLSMEMTKNGFIQCSTLPKTLSELGVDYKSYASSITQFVEMYVLCWNGIASCYTNIRMYPAGTKFFRVKKLKGTKIPNERFRAYQDYWETNPKYLTTYGRLNKPGESLLYVSPDLDCCIDEVHIQKEELFAAIRYTAKSDVKVNMIGGEMDYDQLGIQDRDVKVVNEIYNNFLRDEFSRDVGKGTEYIYRVSEMIAKNYFDLPPRVVQDAWAYSSVQNKMKYNVCFRPDIAHEILELDGAMLCKTASSEKVEVLCVAVGADENNNILFYPLGSDQQKQAFPEIGQKV